MWYYETDQGGAVDVLWFDLPDDDGRVTIRTRPHHDPEPTTFNEALDRPMRKFRLWHACGGMMELVTRSPKKTVLSCQNCGTATDAPPATTLGTLFIWILNGRLSYATVLGFDPGFTQWLRQRPPSP